MCGIAGVMAPGHRNIISKLTDTMKHRGPDDEGFYHDDSISIGQRRLSIVDVAGGHQPICNEEGNLQLVCNGEIYNSPELRRDLEARGHVFKTHTDVETALHLYEEYGANCTKHLRGMFGIAIWNARDKSLFLARDHMGQKPLFYYYDGKNFLFASEVKAILASGLVKPELDLTAIWHYMSLRFIPDDRTLFKNIKKLPAATSLLFDGRSVKTEQYWSLDFKNKISGSERDVTDELEHLLRETVKLHLLSDVPVGTFLSGGIDSSLVTALMAEITGEAFPTFSIGVKEQGFNELPYARMVSDKYRLSARERIVEADMINLIPSMIHHMDEPSDPFGVGVYLVSQVAAEEVKVVLSGDGGDENFAGYDRFAGQRMVDFYCLLPAWFRRTVMKKLTSMVPESFGYKSLAQKVAWVNDMSFYEHGERYAQSASFLRFTPEHKDSLFTGPAKTGIADADSFQKILTHFNCGRAEELVDQMLYTDLMTRMPDHLLPIVDRMAMAHSLEARPPLIDHKVTEFAASIPGGMKLKGRDMKHILKQVASRHLPQELIYRKKQGFGFPIALWMRSELSTFLKNLFAQSKFVELGIFDGAYVDRLLDEHLSGKRDHNFRLWILLNLEIWYRLYFEGETVESMKAFIASIR